LCAREVEETEAESAPRQRHQCLINIYERERDKKYINTDNGISIDTAGTVPTTSTQPTKKKKNERGNSRMKKSEKIIIRINESRLGKVSIGQ